MKKIIFFWTVLLYLLPAYAQVGINTYYVNSSAVLDIHSSNKGVLIPKIHLSSILDDVTIADPANGLLIYNTNDSLPEQSGFYYNKGTSLYPLWISLKTKEFRLPYKDSVNSVADAINIQNTGAGNALTLSGKIKISDTQEPAGRFMMTSSWPAGDVNWVGGSAFSVYNVGGDYTVASNIDIKFPLKSEMYDIGNNFVLSGSIINPNTFIAPATGIYHFDATLLWNSFTGSTTSVFGALTIWVNDVVYAGTRQGAAGNISFSNILSTDIKLIAGDKVYLTAYHNSSTSQTISHILGGTRFSGRFVSTF